MQLGVFSISLTVKDLDVSRAFYEKLGFEVTGGAPEQNYLIMVNETCVIGLFLGMFDKNILTFNPGWGGPHLQLESFTDVRELCRAAKAAGLEVGDNNVEESESGPAYFTLTDPDGNPLLFDQHV